MTFSFTAPLIGTDADVKSSKLNALFTEIETELADLGGASDLKFPSAAAASQYQAMLLNAAKDGFTYNHVIRGTAALSITGVGTNGQVPVADGAGALVMTSLPESPFTSQTSNFTAVTGGNYIVGSSVTQITLPNSPAVGNSFTIYPGNGTNLTAVSIVQAASGERIGGANATYVCPNDKTSYTFVCVNTGSSGDGWIPVGSAFGRQIGVDPSICNFRLSLASATPVTTTNQTGKTTVYAALYKGNRMALYNSTTAEWEIYPSAELSVAVPATTTTPFDVTATPNVSTGAITLGTVDWTNDTTRATAITYQDGVPMVGSAKYLGTCRTTGVSGQTQTTTASKLVWNYYNRVDDELIATVPTGSWTLSSTSYTTPNGNTTVGEGRVEFVIGIIEDSIEAINIANAQLVGSPVDYISSGIGIDSTSTNSAQISDSQGNPTAGAAPNMSALSIYTGKPSVGYHYIQKLEACSRGNSNTSYGTSGNAKTSMLVKLKG